jgi:hypothetical protein
VGKVPLLPGTCYIEFVRVVVAAAHGVRLYSLERVAFQSIMFLDDDAQLLGAPRVRLQLDQTTGSIGISSKRGGGVSTLHADMLLRLRERSNSSTRLHIPDVQACCSESVTGEPFYAATGNDYRGEFRALKQGWGGVSTCLALVEYARQEAEQQHLRACAFLDACSHAALWWTDHGRRPFYAAAVDAYHVISTDRSRNRVQWSTTSAPTDAEPAAYRIFDSRGECLVHTTGGRSGSFDVDWLEERRTRRHTHGRSIEPTPTFV